MRNEADIKPVVGDVPGELRAIREIWSKFRNWQKKHRNQIRYDESLRAPASDDTPSTPTSEIENIPMMQQSYSHSSQAAARHQTRAPARASSSEWAPSHAIFAGEGSSTYPYGFHNVPTLATARSLGSPKPSVPSSTPDAVLSAYARGYKDGRNARSKEVDKQLKEGASAPGITGSGRPAAHGPSSAEKKAFDKGWREALATVQKRGWGPGYAHCIPEPWKRDSIRSRETTPSQAHAVRMDAQGRSYRVV